MVVVSDGGDTCGGDPCAAARAAKAVKPDLTINVIDLSGGTDGGVLRCVADAGGGKVFAPSSARPDVDPIAAGDGPARRQRLSLGGGGSHAAGIGHESRGASTASSRWAPSASPCTSPTSSCGPRSSSGWGHAMPISSPGRGSTPRQADPLGGADPGRGGQLRELSREQQAERALDLQIMRGESTAT